MSRFAPTPWTSRDGTQLVLRTLAPSDAPSFGAFNARIAEESTHTLRYVGQPDPNLEALEKRWSAAADDASSLYLGAFAASGTGERLVGLVAFYLLRPEHPWLLHIGHFGMMILKEHWGQGLGTQFLSILDAHAARVGCLRIEAEVRTPNERGLALYLRAGYEIEGTRRGAARIDGAFVDSYVIAKRFGVAAPDRDRSWRPKELSTQRLLLRGLELSDALAIFAYARDPEVAKWTLWSAHESPADSRAFIREYAFPSYARRQHEPYGLILKDDPSREVVGTVGCFRSDGSTKDLRLEMGYALARPHWGKGLMAEAGAEVLRHLFATTAVDRIQARCKVENVGSARVLEKLGMRYEGTLRRALTHAGRPWDMKYYSILRDDYGAN